MPLHAIHSSGSLVNNNSFIHAILRPSFPTQDTNICYPIARPLLPEGRAIPNVRLRSYFYAGRGISDPFKIEMADARYRLWRMGARCIPPINKWDTPRVVYEVIVGQRAPAGERTFEDISSPPPASSLVGWDGRRRCARGSTRASVEGYNRFTNSSRSLLYDVKGDTETVQRPLTSDA